MIKLFPFPHIRIRTAADDEKVNSPSTKMARSLGRRGITYVRPAASERARRRARGKRQRQARALHRRAARR